MHIYKKIKYEIKWWAGWAKKNVKDNIHAEHSKAEIYFWKNIKLGP